MMLPRVDNVPGQKAGTFLQFLVNGGWLHPDQAQKAETNLPALDPERMADHLRQTGILDETRGSQAMAAFYGQPFVDLRTTVFDPAAVRALPVEMARRLVAVPFFKMDAEISVAVERLDFDTLEALGRIMGCRAVPYLATRTQILDAIEIQYFSDGIDFADIRVEGLSPSARKPEDSSGIQRLSHSLLVNAIKERASDIHLEPEETFMRVRYRVDGLLREETTFPENVLSPLIARYKVMAGMDIAERRRTQDGRIRLIIGSRDFDIRVSAVPSKGKEKLVLRILDKTGVCLDLDHLYLSGGIRKQLNHILNAPSGFILVTGPTGSGKTTLCYSMINRLNILSRNIVTIEDPVEYRFPIVTQIQVEHELDMSFPTILRSVLRQDPNVIFVGEIRDLETAHVASEAALTGHLVLSTLHVNTAVHAVIRLVEMGMEPFMVAPCLEGVIGQRLVRRLCPRCRISEEATAAERALFHLPQDNREPLILYRGKGCEACHGAGYAGRLAVHELVSMTDGMRELIMKGASVAELEKAAMQGGYRPVRYDGLKKALIGLTSLEEVLRVTLDNPCLASAD